MLSAVVWLLVVALTLMYVVVHMIGCLRCVSFVSIHMKVFLYINHRSSRSIVLLTLLFRIINFFLGC